MKTPMQELIEKLEELRHSCAKDADELFYNDGIRDAINLAEKQIKKEKEVIEQAYRDGDVLKHKYDSGQYYHQTFTASGDKN